MREHILENLDCSSGARLQFSCLRALAAEWSSESCDLSEARCCLQELVTSLLPYSLLAPKVSLVKCSEGPVCSFAKALLDK